MALFSRLLLIKPSLLHRHIYTAHLPSNKQKIQDALSLLKSKELNSTKEILNLCHAATKFHTRKTPNVSKDIQSFLNDLKTQPTLLCSFLNELKTRPDLQTETFFCYSMKLYGQSRMIDQAILTFEEMVNHGIAPSTKSLNTLLRATLHLDKDSWDASLTQFRTMHNIKLYVDAYKQWDCQKSLFFTILQEIDRETCKPNSITYNIILAFLYKDEMLAGEMVVFMDQYDMPLNDRAYRLGIVSLCNQKKPIEAKRLLDRMTQKWMNPTADIYTRLILAFGDLCNVDEIYLVFLRMLVHHVKTDRNFYETIVEHLGEKMPVMEAIVRGLVKYNKFQDVKEVIEIMERRGMEIDLTFYNFTNLLCDAANIKLAMEIFERMKSRGIKPNGDTYHHLLRALRWHGDEEGKTRLLRNINESLEEDGNSNLISVRCTVEDGNSQSRLQASKTGVGPDSSSDKMVEKCVPGDGSSETVLQGRETGVRLDSSVLQESGNEVSKKQFRSVPLASKYTDYESLPSHLSRIFKAEEARENALVEKERYENIVNRLMNIKESCGGSGVHHDCFNWGYCLLAFGTCYQFGSPVL